MKVWNVAPRLLRPHPRADLVTPLSEEEYQALRDDIATRGIQVPLAVRNEDSLVLLCGHQRHRAAVELGLQEVPVMGASLNGQSEEEYIILDNLRRRQLTAYERVLLALKLEEAIAEKARGNLVTSTGGSHPQPLPTLAKAALDTREEIASVAHVSHGTVEKVKQIELKATPEQKQKLVRGEATINQVYVEVRRQEVKERMSTQPWPKGKFRVIYADPPWQYSNTQPDYQTVQDDYYPTMPLAKICALPVSDLALDDAVLFLWATSPMLEDAVMKVIPAWGFEYKASFVWDKVKHNMGHYNSVRHEFLLIATRGSCQPDHLKLFDSVQTVERGEHSAKPEVFRTIIDTIYPLGPRIELFARRRVEGWEAFGNDIS